MELDQATLDDKYTLTSGRIYLSGTQALVRLALMQQARDREAGLNTGGFISGYRGSPLGSYDFALWQARAHLKVHNIHFAPGVNEDLAATAVWGSQQTGLFPGAKVDGVFGIWYGKGPGVDRSTDPFKHANGAGTAKHGGVLAIAGDDHVCVSSTNAHQSEQIFQAVMMPILNPATVQDYLDFGIFGFALSRYAGIWVGFKALAETVESSASVDADPHRVTIVEPTDFTMPPDGLNIRWPETPLAAEKRLHGPKLEAVAAFARANTIDRIVFDPPRARLGIITAGKAYLDLRQALSDLGLDQRAAEALGIRVYKLGLTWPVEAEGARRFAAGLEDVLVVEEKRGFIEDQLVKLLYNAEASRRPSIVGKSDETGAPLLPSAGELAPLLVARAVLGRLKRLGIDSDLMRQRLARLESFEHPIEAGGIKIERSAYFCSGCPHNTSTRVPEGSRALAGIGCHFLAQFIPSRHTDTFTHMGGEGAAWIGQAPFSGDKHVFQNLGDGTYQHSGLLAIRAAAAAGVNITYKILFNDAVAMTGGQKPDGNLTVSQITRQVEAEGAKKIVVVTDEPDKYPPNAGFAPGTEIRHRDALDAVQKELREIPGLTVMVYDQTCAAEKRRRRKRGTYPDPAKRVFINEAVCEGCGDCSDASNCVSVKPLETEFGRKRVIDQSSCNKDYSCLKGFCPSFVTVYGGELRKAEPRGEHRQDDILSNLPLPAQIPTDAPYSLLITGIGGTGIITMGALLGMAAHLDGKACTVLDNTGIAQKNGAVMSHVRIAATPEELHAVRIAPGGADAVLACDMVVAASGHALATIEHGVTRIIANSDVEPTSAFVTNNDIDFEIAAMQRSLKSAAGENQIDFIDATGLATGLMGDSIATNMFVLGYAFQKGLVPITLPAIERAITLNGVAVGSNQRVFAWGRLAAIDRRKVSAMVKPRTETPPSLTLAQLVEHRATFLTAYQSAAYAERYRSIVARVAAAEQKLTPHSTGLTEAVARHLGKLMAYKDEYEVARLYVDGSFQTKLQQQFAGDVRLEFNLAPPLFARRDPTTGHLVKGAYGPWVFHLFKLLAALRGLRGTVFDIFGRTAERRQERQLIVDYERVIDALLASLNLGNHSVAVEIANLPGRIRGFGHVKERNIAAVKTQETALLARFRRGTAVQSAAE
jgi:indolepyruvate ferredoxin oxidoreductase